MEFSISERSGLSSRREKDGGNPGIATGAGQFNQRRYFDAHELWEEVWRSAIEEEKLFLQGLVQSAVALHHYSADNLEGARSVMRRAIANLTGAPSTYHGFALQEFRSQLEEWQRALESHGKPLPPELHNTKQR